MRTIVTVYGYLALLIIAVINPVSNYIFIGDHSLHSIVLIPFFLIALILLFFNHDPDLKLGVLVSMLFLVISFISPYRQGDMLFVFYNLAFFSNGTILKNPLSRKMNGYIFRMLYAILIIAMIHSFGLAFGFWESPKLNVDLLGQRIGRSGDILELIPFTIPFFLYLTFITSNRSLKLTSYVLIILGMLRLIATGTRGITAAVIIAFFYFLIFYQVSLRKVTARAIFLVLLIVVPLIMLTQNIFVKQITALTNQYIEYNAMRGFDTGISRIIEANNDWETFLDYPMFGSGFAIAGQRYNTMGEPSYGHFFLTGLLARTGAIGTLALLLAYFLFFRKVFIMYKDDRARRFFFSSTFIIIFAYFVLGNPMYLLMVWPVLPAFWSIVMNHQPK